MRYALLSGIHANLPALEVVLEDLRARRGVGAIYHLGDLVGYAPWPDEVVALLARSGIPGVAGNYDSTVATDHKHCGCRFEDPVQEALSDESYAWTRAHVSAETKRMLGALPFRIDLLPLAYAQHALLESDRSDKFCLTMATQAGLKRGDVIAFGHTHIPWYGEFEGIHFVNTGSGGRPKDGGWRAGFCAAGHRCRVGASRYRPRGVRCRAGGAWDPRE